jgi:hypothetical protein
MHLFLQSGPFMNDLKLHLAGHEEWLRRIAIGRRSLESIPNALTADLMALGFIDTAADGLLIATDAGKAHLALRGIPFSGRECR